MISSCYTHVWPYQVLAFCDHRVATAQELRVQRLGIGWLVLLVLLRLLGLLLGLLGWLG